MSRVAGYGEGRWWRQRSSAKRAAAKPMEAERNIGGECIAGGAGAGVGVGVAG